MVLIHQQFLLVYSESQSKYPKLFEHQYSSLFHLFELYSRDQSLVLFVRSSFVPTLIAREYWVKQTVACVWLQYILYTLLLHNHIIVDYSCKQNKWENKLGRSELTPGWWWGPHRDFEPLFALIGGLELVLLNKNVLKHNFDMRSLFCFTDV